MIQSALVKLADKKDLTFDETRDAVGEIFSGEVSPVLVAGFLTALRMKGETANEIAGAAQAMRSAATRLELPGVRVVVDTCGTGGDKQGSFNISTAAAFVVAGAGFLVAKHGNRSISSSCGSADVLEALGVQVDPGVETVSRCLNEAGIGFLFAPAFHPAMKHAMPVRRELGLRTVFNLLGPLTNPAGANAQVIGVFSDKMVEVVAKVLIRLGTRHGLVVHGAGHDEITLFGKTHVAEIREGRLKRRVWTAADFGFRRHNAAALRGGTKDENATIIRRVLAGEPGPQRDAVVANAAAALWVAGRVAGRNDLSTLKQTRAAAERSIDSGAAREKLERLVELSRAGETGR
ncbi:MAG: anthranilate phosphoribosyltransferase [Elusimicrobia bacterium]|nr:anthranilate phosphoribosyltransferase [Elusimicrobiota bacterium]MBP9128306.1 anthranilate phosphoribosyltransferase [Elusimicrobiota bacterium]MBP9699464.1 anthranilate phosphoribosyltransferase [Elusimicrobiota bacterium]